MTMLKFDEHTDEHCEHSKHSEQSENRWTEDLTI